MDQYLSRSLKNWVARQRSPENGRERLLQSAASLPAVQDVPVRWLDYVREFAYLQPAAQPVVTWGRSSFTVSMAWPVHIASLIQVAA